MNSITPSIESIKILHNHNAQRARNGLGVERKIHTFIGDLSIWDSEKNQNSHIILLHGNSACKETFYPLFRLLSEDHRVIAVDLLGHGESDDAVSPGNQYSIQNFSLAIQEIVRKLGLLNYSVIGWSLGGHIAIEMLDDERLQKLVISGTPPVEMSPDGFQKGFYSEMKLEYLAEELKEEGAQELYPLLTKETPMTEMEAKRFHAFGNMPTLHDEGLAFLVSAGQRTDGLARKYTLQSFFKPENRNQAEVVTASSKPILAIQGESDAGINNDYIKGLLGDRCVILPGGHGLIYTQASVVGNIVKRFLSGV